LANMMAGQSIQERFAASIEKLKEVFVSLAGPILQIVSPFADLVTKILPLINIVLYPFIEGIKFIGEAVSYVVDSVKALYGALTGSNTQLTKMQALVGTIAGVYGLIKGYALAIQVIEGIRLGIKARQRFEDTAALFLANKSLTKSIGMAIFNVIGSFAKIPFGVGVGLGLLAAAGIASMAVKYANDMVSPGYGKRTLMGPEGSIALNDKDTIIAGTDLFPKQETNNTNINNTPQQINLNIEPLIAEIKQMKVILNQILNKESDIYMDGSKVGKSLALSTSRM